MDTHLTINGIEFEWDEDKNRKNKSTHHIDFLLAARIFFDENRLERPDDNHSQNEERYVSLGWADGILYVIHTERRDAIRLISARLADKDERSEYYAQEWHDD